MTEQGVGLWLRRNGFTQGPSAHSVLVDVEPYDGPLPDVLAFAPPRLAPPT
ncbi:hypothetical protein [Lentzea jiangxiensis]|uniref:Biotin/methionine sulfoxide reductase n=1 Tax=Lentzea jiangxiensis TaxID=641025 RepID=A0A1H0WTV6_9PSEU|nr:hypothetical protein [Lentzea jiangxiensis]SDP93656.1 biotin/methionine sulfoxide reductase [Lentzea jiangxiensis]